MTTRPCIVTGISGLSSADYVEDLIARGANEFFAGYVPPAWYRRYGFEVSPNRRYLPESQFLSRKVLESACDDPCLGRLIFQPFLPV